MDECPWPAVNCGEEMAVDMLREIYEAAGAAPNANEIFRGIAKVATLPHDPVKNPMRCEKVMAALAKAKLGDWPGVAKELNDCD
jgi:hypothetical protein